jgi:hypothetical protein
MLAEFAQLIPIGIVQKVNGSHRLRYLNFVSRDSILGNSFSIRWIERLSCD